MKNDVKNKDYKFTVDSNCTKCSSDRTVHSIEDNNIKCIDCGVERKLTDHVFIKSLRELVMLEIATKGYSHFFTISLN